MESSPVELTGDLLIESSGVQSFQLEDPDWSGFQVESTGIHWTGLDLIWLVHLLILMSDIPGGIQ